MKNKKRIIDKLAKQLQFSNPNHIIEVGCFSDNSACWIEKRPKIIDLKKSYVIVEVLSFNGKGTVLEDVSCYKDKINITFDSEKIK